MYIPYTIGNPFPAFMDFWIIYRCFHQTFQKIENSEVINVKNIAFSQIFNVNNLKQMLLKLQ